MVCNPKIRLQFFILEKKISMLQNAEYKSKPIRVSYVFFRRIRKDEKGHIIKPSVPESGTLDIPMNLRGNRFGYTHII